MIKEFGIKETGILVSCSDYHIFKKMNMTRSQAMSQYLDVVKMALDFGTRPRCHFEDITRADFYGFVVPFADELMKLMKESGIPIKIRMCDTLGYGVTYPGAALPRSVQGIVYGLNFFQVFRPNCWSGTATTISTSGHQRGHRMALRRVVRELLHTGHRRTHRKLPAGSDGHEYCGLRGTTDGMDLTVITEMADYFENELGVTIPPRTPFVGRNFNSTRAGIHADGLLKDEEIYNIFDTEKILNRPVHVAVGAHSGLAGIAHWLNAHFKLQGDARIGKNDPLVAEIKEVVDREFAEDAPRRMATMSWR